LSYATAYPPLGVWGDIENAIVAEFRNILTAYVEGSLERQGGVKAFLNRAAQRVDEALARER
ncbi:MAG: ABC transporter substrate-binding protein, partial [Bacillota bacterium]